MQDVSSKEVSRLVEAGKLHATSDFTVIAELETINICVPTPLRRTKIRHELHRVGLRGDRQVFSYGDAGYPGVDYLSRYHWELVLPLLSKSELEVGLDFFLCFSPESVDPGNPNYQTHKIPKVVGGITPAWTGMGLLFYSQALEKVVPVGSKQSAEMVKLLENPSA